jgi:hypothetical protein
MKACTTTAAGRRQIAHIKTYILLTVMVGLKLIALLTLELAKQISNGY